MTDVTASSGNVFADLGLEPEAKALEIVRHHYSDETIRSMDRREREAALIRSIAEALSTLLQERERLRELSSQVLEAAIQLEVKGPHDGRAWVHLRPNHKRETGFCAFMIDEKDLAGAEQIRAYTSWFAELKQLRDRLAALSIQGNGDEK